MVNEENYSTVSILKNTKKRFNELKLEINQKYTSVFESQKFFPTTTFFAGIISFLEQEDVKKQFIIHLKGNNNNG